MFAAVNADPGQKLLATLTSCTAFTFQPWMFSLKWVAFWNIIHMLVTAAVFHVFSGWLKAEAPENIDARFVAADTFHVLNGWLKAVSP